MPWHRPVRVRSLVEEDRIHWERAVAEDRPRDLGHAALQQEGAQVWHNLKQSSYGESTARTVADRARDPFRVASCEQSRAVRVRNDSFPQNEAPFLQFGRHVTTSA
jgi:hypothetical protein